MEKYLIQMEEIYNFRFHYLIPSKESIRNKYLEVPSIGLAVLKERVLCYHNFKDSLDELHSRNKKMLNLYEFKEFLKFAKEKDVELYDDITKARSPWRSEWIDSRFQKRDQDWFVTYHIFDENGNIQEKTEKLDENTLMENKTPGISIDSWLNDSTMQGLPKKSTHKGELFYYAPRTDFVTKFESDYDGAFLSAMWNADDRFFDFGSRLVEKLK